MGGAVVRFISAPSVSAEKPRSKLAERGGRRTAGELSATAAHRGEAVRGEARTPTAAPPTERGEADKITPLDKNKRSCYNTDNCI